MIIEANGRINDFLTVAGTIMYPAYIIKGSKTSLMIDAGINMFGPLYLKAIKKIVGNEAKLDLLFVTHSHYDHVGAVPYLKRQIPGMMFGGVKKVGDLLGKDKVIKRMNTLSEFQRETYKEIVGDADVRIESVKLDLELKEGDIVDLGGITCKVYETNGHTNDSLSFFLPEDGILFTGEALGLPNIENMDKPHVVFLSSSLDYLNSIKKLKALNPKALCFGHGWILTGDDVPAFFEKATNYTYEYIDLIKTYLGKVDNDVKKAIEIMGKKEYYDTGDITQERNAYMTNLSAQVKLVAEMTGQKSV